MTAPGPTQTRDLPRSSTPPPRRARVVVIADRDLREQIGRGLRSDHDLSFADHWREGLQLAEDQMAELLLVDLDWSDADAEAVLEALGADGRLRGTNVLVMAARPDPERLIPLLRRRESDLIRRPFELDELRARVDNLVALHRSREVLESVIGRQEQDLLAMATQVSQEQRYLERALRDLEDARTAAENAGRIKTRFLRMVGHELKTPLTALRLNLSTLDVAADDYPDAVAERLHGVSRSTRRLQHLVDTMLEWSRIEAGQRQLDVREIHLADLLDDVRAELDDFAVSKGVSLVVGPVSATAVLASDPSLVRLVLVDLVLRAIQITGAGEVSVEANSSERGWCFDVRDGGPKLDAETFAQALEPLTSPTTQTRGAGSGIELHVIRALAGAVDGELALRAQPSPTNVIELSLPPLCSERTTSRISALPPAKAASAETSIQTRMSALAFLSRAGEILGSSLDVGETLDDVARLAVQVVADWCAVDLVGPDGTLGDFAALAHRDPQEVERLRELRKRYPPRVDAARGIGRVVRTGEPELFEELREEHLGELALDDAHQEGISAMGLRSLIIVPLMRAGEPIGAVSLATAESGRELGPDDLHLAMALASRASVALENARLHERSEREVALRDRILAIVSHDLRNPIGSIMLASQLLLEDPALEGAAEARKRIDMIRRNAARAVRLTDDLHDVANIQKGTLSLELAGHAIEDVVGEAVEAHEPAAQGSEIALEADLRVSPGRVRCDRLRILQVLSNLIGNALKFCDAGDRISVRAEDEGARVRLSVADTGPGIEADQLEHVFDLHYKGRRSNGSGLGLFISTGILRSHGTQLEVASAEGEGATFSFTLPRAEGGETG